MNEPVCLKKKSRYYRALHGTWHHIHIHCSCSIIIAYRAKDIPLIAPALALTLYTLYINHALRNL